MSHIMVFFVFNVLSLEVVVRFVDIGGVVDHQSFHNNLRYCISLKKRGV